MAAPIGVGDWVECIDMRDYPGEIDVPPLLRLGRVYRVAAFVQADLGEALELCEFRDIKEDGWPPCFMVSRFRPIYRPRADFIEALKAPVTRTPRPAKKSREDA